MSDWIDIFYLNYNNNRELIKVYFQEQDRMKSSSEPYIAWTHEPFRGQTITINNNGDRVHEGVGRDRSNKSVYFFGGSTMWGLGVLDNDTIPALFSSISGMHSYNKGELGFNSRQAIVRLVNILTQGEPIDIVIFYDGVKDVAASCRAELKVSEHYNTEVFRKRTKGKGEVFREYVEEKTLTNENAKLFLSESEFLQYLDFVFLFGTRSLVTKINRKLFSLQTVKRQGESTQVKRSVDDSYLCDNSMDRAQRVAESIVNNWEIAYDLAEARGIKFLAILQPVVHVGNPKLTHLRFNPWDDERGLQFKAVYPLIKEIIQKRGHK